jgi:hypothetical protein
MTFDDVRKISLVWPEVEDGTSYGTPQPWTRTSFSPSHSAIPSMK